MNNQPPAPITLLVTGGTGFIGTELIKLLKGSVCRTRVLSRQTYVHAKNNLVSEDDWITASLLDEEKLQASLKDIDVVINLAGLAHTGSAQREEYFEANFLATKNLFNVSMRSHVNKFIHISSAHAAYPNISHYAESKRLAEDYLTLHAKLNAKMQTTILRPSAVYGIGMKGNLKTFIRLLSLGFLPSLPELNAQFTLTSVKDLCRIIELEAMSPARTTSFIGYNVSDGETYSPQKIERMVLRSLGKDRAAYTVPRFMFYFASVIAIIANHTGMKKNQLGLRLHQALTTSRNYNPKNQYPNYNFCPLVSLETEITKIIDNLT